MEMASGLGLDQETFAADMKTENWSAFLQAQVREARGLNVTGTPTLFVNGQGMDGAEPMALKKMVDRILMEH